jgi:transcriptional regulator with XRE-family HTH domain
MRSHLIIREARRRARLTQAELAQRARTTQSAIARWETGNTEPSWEKLQELVACCGLELTITMVERRDAEERALDQRRAMTADERLRYLMAALPYVEGDDGTDATGFAGDEPRFDPAGLLEVLVRHDVRFVLIGGLAAVLHGSPYLTEDVDISPAPEPGNAQRLATALVELEARPAGSTRQGTDGEHLSPDRLQSVTAVRLATKLGRLDLMWEPAGTGGFEDLRAHARATDVGGLSVLVASLPDVIRSKEAAGRSDDRATVPTLRRLTRGLLASDRDAPGSHASRGH